MNRTLGPLVVVSIFWAYACRGDRRSSAPPLEVVQSGVTLPVGWSEADVGTTALAASSYDLSTGALTISGNGDGVQNDGDPGATEDHMHFAYRQVTGDVEVVARLVSFQGPSDSDVGVTLRTATGPSDTMAAGLLSLGACSSCVPVRDMFRVTWRRPPLPGGGASGTAFIHPPPGGTNKIWLRLQRIGNDFSVARRTEGSAAWIPVNNAGGGAFALPNGQSFNAGFFVSGGATAILDNIYVGPPRRLFKTGFIGNSYDRASTGRLSEYMDSFAVAPDGSRIFKYSRFSETSANYQILDGATGKPLLPSTVEMPGGGVQQGALAATTSIVYVAIGAPGGGNCLQRRASDYGPVASGAADNCPPSPTPGPLTRVGGMAVGNGKVYVTQPADPTANPPVTQDRVAIFDATTLAGLGTFSVPPRPAAVAVDSFGSVWVLHAATDYPQVANLDVVGTASIKEYTTVGAPTGRTIAAQNPSALAYKAAGDQLLVAENGSDQRIRVFSLTPRAMAPAEGTPIGTLGGIFGTAPSIADARGLVDVPTVSSPRLYNVLGLAIDTGGNVFVASRAESVDIRKVSPAGATLWQTFGLANRYNAMDFDPATDGLDVYSARHHLVFDPTNALPWPMGTHGDSEWRFKSVTWDFFPPPRLPGEGRALQKGSALGHGDGPDAR